jgi:hypothetical protein
VTPGADVALGSSFGSSIVVAPSALTIAAWVSRKATRKLSPPHIKFIVPIRLSEAVGAGGASAGISTGAGSTAGAGTVGTGSPPPQAASRSAEIAVPMTTRMRKSSIRMPTSFRQKF